MNAAALSKRKDFLADVFYQNFISADKSEEIGVLFLGLDMKNRKQTYSVLKEVANLAADLVMDKISARGETLPASENEKIVQESIESAVAIYQQKNEQ